MTKFDLESKVSRYLEDYLVPCESIDIIEELVSSYVETGAPEVDEYNAEQIIESVEEIIGINNLEEDHISSILLS